MWHRTQSKNWERQESLDRIPLKDAGLKDDSVIINFSKRKAVDSIQSSLKTPN